MMWRPKLMLAFPSMLVVLIVASYLEQVIAARKTELRNDDCISEEASIGKGSGDLLKNDNEPSRKPFLDLLIQRQREGHEVLEDDIIRDTALTVTAAVNSLLSIIADMCALKTDAKGHDTAANTISWAMFFIGSDLEIQRIVHAELDDIFLENCNREITLDDVSRMKYLESCIHETLRLTPAFPHILRYIHEDIKLDDGKVLPAGADAFVFIYGLHRNQQTFPDPEKFDPSRFFPENSRGRHPYSYVPFSAGPKSCLGYRYAITEMKIFLAHVFREFCVTAVDKLQDIGLLPDLVLRPKAGIRVTLKHRL